MITVSFCNEGGELDRIEVTSEEDAARAAIELIQKAGALYDGDKIVVTETE